MTQIDEIKQFMEQQQYFIGNDLHNKFIEMNKKLAETENNINFAKKEFMEITIKKTIKEKVNVALPFYRKDNCHHYKAYNEKNCIQVTNLWYNSAIQIVHISLAISETNVECTREEFEEAFNKVKEQLTSLI